MVGERVRLDDKSSRTPKIPNLFRNSVPLHELRHHPRFIALPPVKHLRVCGPDTFRYAWPVTCIRTLSSPGFVTSVERAMPCVCGGAMVSLTALGRFGRTARALQAPWNRAHLFPRSFKAQYVEHMGIRACCGGRSWATDAVHGCGHVLIRPFLVSAGSSSLRKPCHQTERFPAP